MASPSDIKTVVIVIRVSTLEQARRGTYRKQQVNLPAYAERCQWEVLETVEDLAKSGRRLAGRAAETLLERIDNDEIHPDALLVENSSRIFRRDPNVLESMHEWDRIVHTLRKKHVLVADAGGHIYDLADANAYLQFQILTAVDEKDWQDIQQKLDDGRWQKARDGKKPWGVECWGLKYIKVRDPSSDKIVDEYYVFDSEVVPIIQRIFELCLSGLGVNRIADLLNEEGVPTRGSSKRWSGEAVHRVLKQETYCGRLFSDRKNHPDLGITVPSPGHGSPPVSPEVWDAAQAALKSRRKSGGPKQHFKHDALCRQLIRCECGQAMHVRNSKWKRKDGSWNASLVYVCGERTCRKTISTAKVDAEVWRKVEELISDPKVLEDAARLRVSDAESGVEWDAQIQACERNLRKLDECQMDTLRLCRQGKITKRTRDRELATIKKQVEQIELNMNVAREQLAARQALKNSVSDLHQAISQIRYSLAEAGFGQRRSILRTLIPNRRQYGISIRHSSAEIELRGIIPFPVAGSAEDPQQNLSKPSCLPAVQLKADCAHQPPRSPPPAAPLADQPPPKNRDLGDRMPSAR
jgi:DNA invertase Pin-like site-specific DNA recombinase